MRINSAKFRDGVTGSSRTGLDLEDTSRTKFCGLGLGLGLDDVRPWLWLQDLAIRR